MPFFLPKKPAVTSKPVLSGCMTDKRGNLIGYTQQGTMIHGLKQSDCKRIINGDRPFNYFAQSSGQATTAQVAPVATVPEI
ncbi:hypothetical protein [Acinetobacter baumannii]|uniref:hypothetical protein n=1 Tax=Acinetobacter baumannii TaxID=470 RepID=UPI0002CE5CDE|nr:hypothetical protein F978_02435 [Acinetobacter baumannii NIPH 615]MBD0530374.1 hypothetical protein [Acinetobacter baumannii]MCE6122086.1 hypothetical protein [Acinetobacter baumannii]MCE6140729.1 hypothetical protein [Acinetobacter baumannii]RDM52308.1 hypothetical protein B8U65_10315 [Acinetobacter baumannii]